MQDDSKTITFRQFLARERDRIDQFEAWYYGGKQTNPLGFPSRREPEDWAKQLRLFEADENSGTAMVMRHRSAR